MFNVSFIHLSGISVVFGLGWGRLKDKFSYDFVISNLLALWTKLLGVLWFLAIMITNGLWKLGGTEQILGSFSDNSQVAGLKHQSIGLDHFS